VTQGQAMQGNSTSSVLGRRLGGELLKLRTAAGLTQPQAAKVLTASTAKVAKMERGWVPIRDPDIRALCELYGVNDPGVVSSLLELAQVDRERRKSKGWWDDFPSLGDMKEYVNLEDAATTIRAWQLTYIPGLLQTPEYIRALRDDPSEPFVEARLRRQRRLDADPPLTLDVVLYEAALRHLVGSPDVMAAQLEHLTTMAGRPHITLRVLPFSAGALLGMNCTFNVLSFAEPGAMDVVYMELAFTRRWVEGGKEAVQHADLFEKITARALDPSDSLSLIDDIRNHL
jgi:transcriptional regulator with XRE-family HTH domain